MKKCSKCEENHYAVFVFNGARQLCRDCWMDEKTQAKKLIRRLPSVSETEAPLGYNLVWFDYYRDSSKGKSQANTLYKYNRMGMVN